MPMISSTTKKRLKRLSIYALIIFVSVLLLTLAANYKLEAATKAFVFDSADKLPETKVGLLLGTSPNLRNGNDNPYFYYRIIAAVELFQKQKIRAIIVSGDNSKTYYNEPAAMKEALIKAGIPDTCIYLDYAGFRTLDSVVRAKEIFGQTQLIVISQKFHNERAVYLAQQMGIDARGYNAKDVGSNFGFKTKLREFFARDKVFIDLLFGVSPKFLGEKIHIG